MVLKGQILFWTIVLIHVLYQTVRNPLSPFWGVLGPNFAFFWNPRVRWHFRNFYFFQINDFDKRAIKPLKIFKLAQKIAAETNIYIF